MNKYIIVVTLSALILGCNPADFDSNRIIEANEDSGISTREIYRLSPENMTAVEPGWAFNTYTKALTPLTCVYGQLIEERGNRFANVDIDYDASYSDNYQSLYGDLGLGVKLFSFEGYGNASVAQDMTESPYSTTISLKYEIKDKKTMLVPFENGALGIDTVACPSDVGGNFKADLYGDSYVSNIIMGAKLALFIKVSYESQEDKSVFSGAINIDGSGIFSLGGSDYKYIPIDDRLENLNL
jgi:hypothetical protein